MKEKLIENLRNEAFKKIRLERKDKQLSISLKSLLILYVTFCIVAVIFLPQSPGSLSIIFETFVYTCALAIIIFLGGVIILPFGKSTKERIDEKFKEIIEVKIKSKSEEVFKIKCSLLELEHEIEILKECRQ